MTTREQLIDMMRGEGFDYITAAEYVHEFLKEFMSSNRLETVAICGKSQMTIRKTAPIPESVRGGSK